MKFARTLVFVAFVALATSVVAGEDATTTRKKTETTTSVEPETTTTTTTPNPDTTTTTETPETTTTSTTTTTTTTTTTEKPTTTTPKPKPTTTTPEPTSTTPGPAPPKPEANLGNFTIADKDGNLCLYALMKVTAVRNSSQVPLIDGAVDDNLSTCGNDTIHLYVRYEDKNILQVAFTKKDKNYFISEIAVSIPNVHMERGNLTQFSTPENQFYSCSPLSTVDLLDNNSVYFADMKFEAFRTSKKAEFVGTELNCVNNYHSDVVLIAIGCALALVVLVILVAYLIARRRNRQQGYQSV